MEPVPNRANIFKRKVQHSRLHWNEEANRPKTMDEAYPPSQPAPRSAMEAIGIVGNGNIGANIPQSPRGRRGSMDDPQRTRKGRRK
jgi:hypothetical protein